MPVFVDGGKGTAGPSWEALILERRAPHWVPDDVGQFIAAAHEAGKPAPLTPELVRVDPAAGCIVLPGRLPAGAPGDDLAVCLAALFAVAVRMPEAARHAFQQAALLWRAYREARGLAPNSAFENDLVRRIRCALPLDPTDWHAPWFNQDPEPATLHELVDVLHRAIRDKGVGA